MKRILTIVGARPQFIKAAAISHTISGMSGSIEEDILHTGQHYDMAMSGNFFTELDLPLPKYNLGVGSASQGKQTALMMSGIEEVMIESSYDGVIVYGDTNSTLAGALVAAKLKVPVYHVEAGLRSFNRNMPEEVNRIVTDHVSSMLFAPTQTAVTNLLREGFERDRCVFSGDVMLDNVIHYSSIASRVFPFEPFVLATLHRDFNTDNPIRLNSILSALNDVSECLDVDILFPLHPRTRHIIEKHEHVRLNGRVHVLEPLSYLDTLAALQQAKLVLTDSGGLQKESFFCGKNCVILRPETEWVEIVDDGAALLADADPDRILKAASQLWSTTPNKPVQFGDGHAAETIIKHIVES